jgi:hypothetical protein
VNSPRQTGAKSVTKKVVTYTAGWNKFNQQKQGNLSSKKKQKNAKKGEGPLLNTI